MLLKALRLLPLQIDWWHQTLQFWNRTATLPAGSLFYTVLLDSLIHAFHSGACHSAGSVAACLHRVGVSMPRDIDAVLVLDI